MKTNDKFKEFKSEFKTRNSKCFEKETSVSGFFLVASFQRMKKIITNGGVLDDGSLVDPGQIRNVGEGVEVSHEPAYQVPTEDTSPQQ